MAAPMAEHSPMLYNRPMDDRTPSPAASLADRLGQACYDRELEAAMALLAEGADPNEADSVGHLPIERSAIADDAEGVAMLAAAGADPNARRGPDCMPPLSLAAWFGCFDSAKALLDCGADPLALCSRGRSALHYACSEGLAAEGILLARRGGLFAGADHDGRTALDLALASGSSALCSALGSLWPLASLAEHAKRWAPLAGPGAEAHWLSMLNAQEDPAAPGKASGMPSSCPSAYARMLLSMEPRAMAEQMRSELPDPGPARRSPL